MLSIYILILKLLISDEVSCKFSRLDYDISIGKR